MEENRPKRAKHIVGWPYAWPAGRPPQPNRLCQMSCVGNTVQKNQSGEIDVGLIYGQWRISLGSRGPPIGPNWLRTYNSQMIPRQDNITNIHAEIGGIGWPGSSGQPATGLAQAFFPMAVNQVGCHPKPTRCCYEYSLSRPFKTPFQSRRRITFDIYIVVVL